MRGQIASIILNHWVTEAPHPHYASYVKCMANGCGWDGQFPGDIAGHCADLIMEVIEDKCPPHHPVTDWPDIPRSHK